MKSKTITPKLKAHIITEYLSLLWWLFWGVNTRTTPPTSKAVAPLGQKRCLSGRLYEERQRDLTGWSEGRWNIAHFWFRCFEVRLLDLPWCTMLAFWFREMESGMMFKELWRLLVQLHLHQKRRDRLLPGGIRGWPFSGTTFKPASLSA